MKRNLYLQPLPLIQCPLREHLQTSLRLGMFKSILCQCALSKGNLAGLNLKLKVGRAPSLLCLRVRGKKLIFFELAGPLVCVIQSQSGLGPFLLEIRMVPNVKGGWKREKLNATNR